MTNEQVLNDMKEFMSDDCLMRLASGDDLPRRAWFEIIDSARAIGSHVEVPASCSVDGKPHLILLS